MAKDDPEIVRLAGLYVFDLFRNANGASPLVYHGFKRSRALVDDCREIAKGTRLNGGAEQVVMLSAWFHDAAFAVNGGGGREKSIELARAFLGRQGQPESLADAVAGCLRALDDEGQGGDLARDVLHDALLAPLASKRYLEQSALLRLEEARRTGKSWSDVEWTRSRIEQLQQSSYRTRWAQLEYESGRARNLVRLDKLLRRQEDESVVQEQEGAKAAKSLGKVVESVFADLTRNQLRLLSIADRRTATMIHVNAIMISLVIGLVLRKIEEHRALIAPTVLLLAVNLAVIMVSILSMRAARVKLRKIARDEIAAHDTNLLLNTNEADVPLHQYLERMGQLTADAPALQKAMLEYLYFARKLLIGRRKMLQLTYNIFIYGLAASVLLFVIAILRS
jgi:predicted metal-dependent HD superfamily phosphohydrolase